MILNLDLPPELEKSLTETAQQQGLSIEALALEQLKQFVDDGKNRIQAAQVLQSWIDETDTTEQQETGAFLLRVLDQDRPSDCQLFPKDMKGMTW